MFTKTDALQKVRNFHDELNDYLYLLDALKYLYHVHDEYVGDIVKFLASKNEKLIEPLAAHFTNDFDCNDSHKYISYLFYNITDEQMNGLEERMIQITNYSSGMSLLNLEAVQAILEEGTNKKGTWVKLLLKEKRKMNEWVRPFIDDQVRMDYETFLQFTSVSLMGIREYLQATYSVKLDNFDQWSSQSSEYRTLLEKAKKSYDKAIDHLLRTAK